MSLILCENVKKKKYTGYILFFLALYCGAKIQISISSSKIVWFSDGNFEHNNKKRVVEIFKRNILGENNWVT